MRLSSSSRPVAYRCSTWTSEASSSSVHSRSSTATSALISRWWIDELARADPADTNDLQRLLYGLYALITVHLSREEELYAGAVDSRRWPASGDTAPA